MIDPAMFGEEPIEGEKETSIIREVDPAQPESRKALVTALSKMVKEGKRHWSKVFAQMERDQKFAAGVQWPSETKSVYFNDAEEDRYVANLVLRHIQQKVASLYAKNPKAICRKRKRLLTTVWDGNIQTLQMAQGLLQQAQAAQAAMMAPPQIDPMSGMPMPPPPMPDPGALQQAQDVIADAQQAKQQTDMLTRIAETLELLYSYEIEEQTVPFKTASKLVIRRAATTGVGWYKIGFQRVMGKSPDYDTRLNDLQTRLSLIERISGDLADNEADQDSAEAEQLKLALQDLMQEQDTVIREGLQFSYPKSQAIIVDPRCVALRDFIGADWVAEEYLLSINEVKETYGVDIGKSYTAYDRIDTGTEYEKARASWQRGDYSDTEISPGDGDLAIVWEIYNKRDGLVYIVCDGYPEFLREPAAPDPYIERFWPWFPVLFNECDGQVYPPSDTMLMRPMQLELNRARQGMREHRFASRPKMAYAEGLLSQEDLANLRSHPVNALISISGLQPGQDIKQVLQPIGGVPFNPDLYETRMIFEDMMRSVGDQEANLGGTGGATATETQVAQSSRSTSLGSAVDDLDETLSAIAKAAGEILLLNVSEETVKEVCGPGAVWPTLSKADVAKSIYLEIEAASSGKPDQALAISNFERLSQILLQVPGITPTFLAKEAIKRLDDKLDLDQALSEGAPSIMAMNAMKGPGAGPAGPGGPAQPAAPANQGPQGAHNAPAPPAPNSQRPGANTGAPGGIPGA